MIQLTLAVSLSAWFQCVPGYCAIKWNICPQMNLKYATHSPKKKKTKNSATMPSHFLLPNWSSYQLVACQPLSLYLLICHIIDLQFLICNR